MNKIYVIFALIASVTLSSCDSKDNDDAKSINFLKATINGTEYVFDTFNVDKTDYPEDGYSDIQITATKSNDPSKTIILELEYLAIGTETCFEFQYVDGDDYYVINPRENNSLSVDVTENVSNKIRGSFIGTVPQDGETGSVVITNGSVDITY